MAEAFIGEIKLCGFNFAPRGWAKCAGQSIAISQNTALFSLLGTSYGGNGTTTFFLPDLQGRMAIGAGGFASIGERGGSESETLIQNQIPAHGHGGNVADSAPSTNEPVNAYPARSAGLVGLAYATPADAALSFDSVAVVGGGQPHPNLQPYLAMNYCIALQGIFPQRP